MTRLTVASGADVQVVDRATGKSKRTLEIDVRAGATLRFIAFASAFTGTLNYRARIGSRATVHWHLATIDADRASIDLVSRLTGAGAVSTVDWVFRSRKTERLTIGVRNVFDAPDAGGEIVVKGVAQDHATCVVNGMLEIGERGRGTATHLTEDMLMLDPEATVDAVPGLEIRTNDVKASHSATVSKVSLEQMFYLRSRGLSETQARRMFVEGFLGELIAKIPDAQVREEVEEVMGMEVGGLGIEFRESV